jgi:hypothetical protein
VNVTGDAYRSIRGEIARLEVEVARGHRMKQPIDVDRLILGWDAFAREVASGYLETVYEYCRELVMRGLLEEIRAGARPPTEAFVDTQIAGSDSVFRNATMAEGTGWKVSEYFKWARDGGGSDILESSVIRRASFPDATAR